MFKCISGELCVGKFYVHILEKFVFNCLILKLGGIFFMNRKIKRLSILVFSMVLSVLFNTNMLSAKEIDVPVHSQ